MFISSSLAFNVLVEGQEEFLIPPSDNYNVRLDPYQVTSSFTMSCSYIRIGMELNFTYNWAKEGVAIRPSESSISRTVMTTVRVPNGDYDSSVEGTYTCSVSLGGSPRGSRNIIVTLPGKPACTPPTSHIHSQVVSGLLVGSWRILLLCVVHSCCS